MPLALLASVTLDGHIIRGKHDFGIEQLKQGVEIRLRGRRPGRQRRFPASLLHLPGPLGLPSPGGGHGWRGVGGAAASRSAHDGGDFLEGQVEQVVQHEGYPFGGSQCP